MALRLVMMGTGPFAVPTFEALVRSPHEVLCVVTRPTVPGKGRGAEHVNPMRAAAEAHGLPLFAPEDINTAAARDTLASAQADLFVVCDYGQILKRRTLATSRLGGINLHGSILPRYRGAAPLNWAIWQGESKTGVTVIHMTPLLDGGPILAVRHTPIGPLETAAELEPRLAQLGVEPVLESLELLASWDGKSTLGQPQDPALASKAPRLKKTDGLIQWNQTARQIQNQIRALQPWPGCYTFWSRDAGEPLRLVIEQVRVLLSDPADDDCQAVAEPGTIVAATGNQLLVTTTGGLVSIERLQPAGKRMMDVAEFLRGYPLQPGQRLGTTK